MNWRSNHGKSGLIRMLMREHSISKRKAEKAVNAVFTCMARALRRGENVELPVGSIKAVALPSRRHKGVLQKFSNIQTGEIFRRIVRLPNRIIRFTPNHQLICTGPPPDPERDRKQQEVENLFLQMMGREITLLNFKELLAVADGDLDRLLRRLQEIIRDQRRITGFSSLQDTIRMLYWIR